MRPCHEHVSSESRRGHAALILRSRSLHIAVTPRSYRSHVVVMLQTRRGHVAVTSRSRRTAPSRGFRVMSRSRRCHVAVTSRSRRGQGRGHVLNTSRSRRGTRPTHSAPDSPAPPPSPAGRGAPSALPLRPQHRRKRWWRGGTIRTIRALQSPARGPLPAPPFGGRFPPIACVEGGFRQQWAKKITWKLAGPQ